MNFTGSKKRNRMNDELSKPNIMKLEVPTGLTMKKNTTEIRRSYDNPFLKAVYYEMDN